MLAKNDIPHDDVLVPVDSQGININFDTVNNTSYGAADPNASIIDPFSITSLWSAGYHSQTSLTAIRNHKVRAFYESQNELLESMAKVSNHHPSTTSTLNNSIGNSNNSETRVRRAILASNVCNAFLLFAQVYAFVSSRSLSMLAVFIDALLDMVSGLVVASTWYLKRRKDKMRYPVGRARLEPLGVIGMACLMTAATLVALEQSVGAFLQSEPRHITLSFHTAAVLLSALGIKAALFAYCCVVDDDSVQALAEDHFNDCLSNTVSLVTILLANHLVWWVDPLGAIIISCLIIRNWSILTFHHCDQLLGRVASSQILNLITFVACNHSEHIQLVDTVRAYHVGSGIYTEVHVVLDADMPLTLAHDIGESLQTRIETLDEVERCFVHLDVEALHSPNLEHKDI